MAADSLREEERESRWEASPAVAIVIGLQLLLAVVSLTQDWNTWAPWGKNLNVFAQISGFSSFCLQTEG